MTPLTTDQAALVEAHLDQVRRLAGAVRRGAPAFVSRDDLVQWGCLGLIAAAQRWRDARAEVRRLLRQVTRREARLLIAYHVHGRGMRAIGLTHGIGESRVSQLLARVHRRLRETTSPRPGV